jgi:hypothetical protein
MDDHLTEDLVQFPGETYQVGMAVFISHPDLDHYLGLAVPDDAARTAFAGATRPEPAQSAPEHPSCGPRRIGQSIVVVPFG